MPNTAQLDGLMDHIKRMEEEKFDREERYINLKEVILRLYTELEEEPAIWKGNAIISNPIIDIKTYPSCREIACEDTDRFTLSTTNLAQAADILKMLENQLKFSQKRHMEKEENMSSLYETQTGRVGEVQISLS